MKLGVSFRGDVEADNGFGFVEHYDGKYVLVARCRPYPHWEGCWFDFVQVRLSNTKPLGYFNSADDLMKYVSTCPMSE